MKSRQSNLTIFAILTTITLVTWVFIEAYQRFYKIDLTTIPASVIAPLNPELDSKVIEELKQTKQLTEDQLNNLKPIKGTIKPTPTLPAIPTPLPSSTPSPSPIAATSSPTPTPGSQTP